MLVRCTECGKPVYVTEDGGTFECGYCYQQIKADEATPRLEVTDLDWREPLYLHAVASAVGSSAVGGKGRSNDDLEWIAFLGDYEAAPQVLEEHIQALKRRLREERLARLLKLPLLPFIALRRAIRHIDNDILGMRGGQIFTVVALAAFFSLFAFCGISSCAVEQPQQLEEARHLAEQGDYDAAVKIYEELAGNAGEKGTFLNQEVAEAAKAEGGRLYVECGDALMEQGDWMAAKDLYEQAYETFGNREGLNKANPLVARQNSNYVVARIEEGDYLEALDSLWLADEDALAAQGITEQWIWEQWVDAVIGRGDKDEMADLESRLRNSIDFNGRDGSDERDGSDGHDGSDEHSTHEGQPWKKDLVDKLVEAQKGL